ncbi:MAG: hypothetical protein EOO75_07425 [Myxococcales bacterium]|nr:MAG: hypothetical protein EOO75_07425 [Myxococcales bacterium]
MPRRPLPSLLPRARLRPRRALALLALLASLTARPAGADPPPGWADGSGVRADVQAGKPLVLYVVVPLCHHDQIDCGDRRAGLPDDLEHNLYWGAIFGARRFLDRPRSPWTRLGAASGDARTPERVAYRRLADGAPWGMAGKTIEQIVVLQAFHGDAIDLAVDHFFDVATAGGKVTIPGETPREETIHAAIYAGHNRLMDGKTLPAARAGAHGIASVVLACRSEPYWGPALRAAGSSVMLTTRDLMAPEGYLIEAVARSLGANASLPSLRAAAITSGTQWWRLTAAQVGWIFAPPA